MKHVKPVTKQTTKISQINHYKLGNVSVPSGFFKKASGIAVGVM